MKGPGTTASLNEHRKRKIRNFEASGQYSLTRAGRNFIGEKIVRKVTMHPGVDVEPAKNQKDEIHITGISLENVSQSAADIQQICRVRNKDIRKVRIHFEI